MQEAAFAAHLDSLPLAIQTRRVRLRTLQRLEQLERVDLDYEYSRDGLLTLIERYTYSQEDERRARANPTAFTINKSLYTQIAWYRAQLVAYRRFKEGIAPEDEPAEVVAPPPQSFDDEVEPQDAPTLTFGLEADLQRALRGRIYDLEPGLTIVDGGAETHVEAGFIDILAKDTEGRTTVIELKAGQARPEAVTQILAYMGCVAERSGGAVRGILVAADFHPRVIFAARAISNLDLRRYSFRFSFE